MFERFSIDVRWMFGRCAIDAPFPISYFPFAISHFPFHMSVSLCDRRLLISHCRWLGLAECAERLNKTLQTSQNLQANLLGGGFTLPLPLPDAICRSAFRGLGVLVALTSAEANFLIM